MTQAIDSYLATTLRLVSEGNAAPPWPTDWSAAPEFHDGVTSRIMFHGIALVLLRDPGKLASWPPTVRAALHAEASAQTFWEAGHRGVLLRILELLEEAGVRCVVTKGSALAYSVYPEPAMRRRGDSDILVTGASRVTVRRALRLRGFRPLGDTRPLQESWAATCHLGFTHVFDLHWRMNASAALAEGLEQAGVGTRSIALPRLSGTARGIALADNLILVALNRAAHGTFGYQSGDRKLFEQDRLIWALDIDLLCKRFGSDDWEHLLTAAHTSGTALLVHSALTSAIGTLGSDVPDQTMQTLAAERSDRAVLQYLDGISSLERLSRDLAASPGLAAKLRLVAYSMFPGTEVLYERFPEATHWPLLMLRLRRLAVGAARLVRRGA